ncbi:unnamed protein product, partial [Prunus brigantina]
YHVPPPHSVPTRLPDPKLITQTQSKAPALSLSLCLNHTQEVLHFSFEPFLSSLLKGRKNKTKRFWASSATQFSVFNFLQIIFHDSEVYLNP